MHKLVRRAELLGTLKTVQFFQVFAKNIREHTRIRYNLYLYITVATGGKYGALPPDILKRNFGSSE
jgi:hypothetical protein